MGIQGSRLTDQANQLDGEYALVLDSQKNVHHFPGPEGVDNESADNWLELQIFQWREETPTLILKMAPASSGPEFQQQLDQSTDALKFIFQLPAEYPGGRVGLLRTIQDLVAGVNPYGIVETVVGRRVTTRFLTKKRWARQHEKEHSWTNAPKAYNCKVGWTQFSSQYFFKFRVNTGEAALLAVNRHADEYKSAVGQRQTPQQQLYFMQLMTLPVRVWMCVRYHRRPSSEDESEERESQAEKPDAEFIHDASPLNTKEGSSTGILGEFKKLIKDSTQQAARSAADVVDDDELVTGEHPSLDSQGPEKSVVSPSEGKTEEEQEGMSNTPLDQPHAVVCENLTMGKTGLTKNQKKKNQKRRKKAYHKAVREAHADAQPRQVQPNDEQSASAACGAAGQTLVVGNVDLIEVDLRSPTSGSASFLTARSQSPSKISTGSRNSHTPPLAPNVSFTGESDEEGVPEHQTSRVESDSETTSLPGDSREPSQEEVIFLETITGAQPESHVQRLSATATPAKPTTHPREISPRSERESPSPTSKVEPVLGATSPLLVVGDRHEKRDSKAPEGRQDATKSGDELDDTCAATAHVEARQQEVSPQDVSGITDQPLQPRAEPLSGPATHHQPPKKARGQQRAGDITTLAKTPQSLHSSQESTASAEDQSSVLGPVTPRPTSRQLLVVSPESAEIRPLSTAAVSASHPQQDEPSSATTPTRTPGLYPKRMATVGNPTQRGAPVKRVPPAKTPRLSRKAVVPAGRGRRGAPRTYAHPAKTSGFHTAVPAGRKRDGGFVSGVNPARMPGPMMAVVPAGPRGGFAPSPTVAPGYGAYQQSPSQWHQAPTPAATSWEGNPVTSQSYVLGNPHRPCGGGAYPTPPTKTAPGPSDVPGRNVEYKQKEPEIGKFFWDLTFHSFRCAKAGCWKQCNLWDCQSVVCPFCGPFSRVMYCGKEHMREDVKIHWLHCGQASMKDPCVDNSIPPDIRVGPPAIPCKNGWDSPERHRQAMWFTTARQEGDYFLFADWEDSFVSGTRLDEWEGRCSPRVALIVRFADPVEKDRFRRILAVCLLESVEVQPLVAYMFRLLRDRLQAKNQWSPQLDFELRRQISWELGVSLDPEVLGLRHACETEWNGRPPRHCRDPICFAEWRNLLGTLGWDQCFERLVSNEECSHWLLRAHRTTHPTVTSVYDRTRGEGFDDVVDEEKRLFRRGEAWDGPGTGLMEMEGPEVC
ncbi:uncharacterized protein N7496_002801 [Penicillium cataractarum]|uniref:Uncharacterized protein n=1 Tax=Penicillium cataractarum TaxID=2100454 RepID=A0A9W9SKT0_9EURO|nr:uncharacterized protein N7496_002801 [Penicillium cataractarum]KAJ5380373.1 hypothetical protein N7496_002801 [Penicillium cataractarum]